MKPGRLLRPGDVVLARIQFVDTLEIKVRPALILFEERGNVVVAGITSNLGMEGIALGKADGAVKDSVIKLNYIFTISEGMVSKVLFRLSDAKRAQVANELLKRLDRLRRA